MNVIFTDESGEVTARFDNISKAKQKQIDELLGTSRSKKNAAVRSSDRGAGTRIL